MAGQRPQRSVPPGPPEFPSLLPLGARGWVRLAALGAAVCLVLWWTLLPFTRDLSPQALARAFGDIQWIPFVERGRLPLWSDMLGNLALFTPFGFTCWRYLEGRRWRVARLLAAALSLSVAVELVQLALPARRTSGTDVVMDALGALLGAGIGRGWELRGREATRAWLGALGRGEPAYALVALWAGCLAVWALLPGPNPAGSLWSQTQTFSSSFRRFPGWGPWLTGSVHTLLLGGLFAALAARTGRSRGLRRAAAGALAAFLLGLGLESLQLMAPGRRPDIFQALAFAAGGIPGALLGLARGRAPLAAGGALAVLGAALLVPRGDLPAGETWAVLLLGSAFLALGSNRDGALRAE